MENCLFCKIAQHEIPSTVVYEDENTIAFLDIRPNDPGHTLVVPKLHSENIYTISDESLCETISIAKKIAGAIKKGLGASGINITMNNEPAAGQIIFHSHFHIIPRFNGEKPFEIKQKTYREGDSGKIAKLITGAL